MRFPNLLRHPIIVAVCAFAALGLVGLMPADPEGGGTLPILRMTLALVGILALAQAAVPMLKRLPGGARGEGRRLRCDETLSIDSRHRLALVSVDGRELLLSLQTDGTRLIADLGQEGASPDPEALEAEPENFAALLARRRGT